MPATCGSSVDYRLMCRYRFSCRFIGPNDGRQAHRVRFFGLLSMLALGTDAAFAATPAASRTVVEWKAVDGCPSERELISRVEAYLGQPLDVPREQALRLRAEVHSNESKQYEVVLVTEGASGTGQRRFADADCRKLADATALVMALAIDPKLVESRALELAKRPANDRGSVAPMAAATDSATVGFPTNPASAPAAIAPQARRGEVRLVGTVRHAESPNPSALRLLAMGLVGQGLLPSVDLGAAALVTYSLTSKFTLRSGFASYLPMEQSVFNSNAALAIRTSLLDVGLCVHPFDDGRWQSQVCLAAEAGLMWGDGRGGDMSNLRRQSSAIVTTVAELGYGYRLATGFGAVGTLGCGVAAWRPKFGIVRNGEPEENFRPALASFRVGFGLYLDLF